MSFFDNIVNPFKKDLRLKLLDQIHFLKKEKFETISLAVDDLVNDGLKEAILNKIDEDLSLLIFALDKINAKYNNTYTKLSDLDWYEKHRMPFEAKGILLNIKHNDETKFFKMLDLKKFIDHVDIKINLNNNLKFFEKSKLSKKMTLLYFRKMIQKIIDEYGFNIEETCNIWINDNIKKSEFNKKMMIEYLRNVLYAIALYDYLLYRNVNVLQNTVIHEIDNADFLINFILNCNNFKAMVFVRREK